MDANQRRRALTIVLLCLFACGACRRQTSNGNAGARAESTRLVTAGTSITETIYALGAGAQLVGTDNSSHEYLAETATLPTVGALRSLSAEGILSLRPTLFITTSDAGPPEVVGQLKGAGVGVLVLSANYSVEEVKARVRATARALSLEAKGEEVVTQIERDMAEAAALVARAQERPKVMFCGRGPNMPNATLSGRGTTINTMIELAGGTNPVQDFEGFRPMTDEAVVNAQPDVILMTEHSFARSGGVEGVLKFPGVALTPAGRNRRIVAVSDMYFQGFGPGVGRAVRALVSKLHPELNGEGKQ